MTARILIAAWLALATPAIAAPPPSNQQAANLRTFDSAWSIVGRRYWDRTMHGIDWAETRAAFRPQARDAAGTRQLYAVINAMLDRLGDSHVYATSPERRVFNRAQDKDGTESGFGFDAYWAKSGWLVHAVQAGGPAAAAGMQIGWKLVTVDGRPVDIDDHFGTGDKADLVLQDENGGLHAMTLQGISLPVVPSRRARRLGGGVLLLAFDQFAPGEDRWLRRELAAPPPRAVILDLRENEGGAADILDRIAGLFFSERRVILRLSARRTRDETARGTAVWLGPLALLVGPRTASAAEALAAFLDEAGRALTVGEQTAGALTAGTEHRLPGGGQLTVAEFDIRTPAGNRLEGVGFRPAYPVTPTLRQLRTGQDPVLDDAIALLAP